MLITIFNYLYKYIYTFSRYVQNMMKIEGYFWYPIPSIHPSIPSVNKLVIASMSKMCMVFKITVCTCVSKRILRLNFERQIRFFKILEKNWCIFKTPTDTRKKRPFGTKYSNTYLQRVLSKMGSPTPNLTSNFESHENVGDNF